MLGQVDDLPDNPLALWGQFSCQLHARPSCFLKQDLDGHLLLQVCANHNFAMNCKFAFQ